MFGRLFDCASLAHWAVAFVVSCGVVLAVGLFGVGCVSDGGISGTLEWEGVDEVPLPLLDGVGPDDAGLEAVTSGGGGGF